MNVFLRKFVDCVAAWVLLSFASTAFCQMNSTEVFRLPWMQSAAPPTGTTPPPVSRSGLELEVDTRWADTFGYRPLKFTFTSRQPASHDYAISVRFYADDLGQQDFRLWVEQDGKLPAGKQSVVMNLRAPQYDSWYTVRWEVWIDGVKEPLLSVNRPGIPFNRWQQGGLTLFYAIVDPDSSAAYSSSMPVGDTFYGVQIVRATGPLPEVWLDYSCYDFVVMSLDDLIAEASHHPERIAALRRWLRTGGNLWVENAGRLPDRLMEVSKLLALSEEPLPEPADSNGKLPGDWSYLNFETAERPTNDNRGGPSAENPFDFNWLQSFAPGEQDSREWFAERPVGFGKVTTFVDEWSDVPSQLDRRARGLASRRWAQRMWMARHGLAPNVPNREFSNFLISGVGLAPVTEFRVLITIFVLLIGPLNYWVLSRAKRLHLLVLTVPLGAAAVTLLLFSYAFLTDGFATQLRARSLTILDQPNGTATSWSRLSYYAGIAPSEGLRFPADTVVYPILSEYSGGRLHSESGRTVLWSPGEQALTRGWLSSRTPTQYLAVRTHNSDARLEVRATAARCQVTNRLDATLESLLVVDESGNMWHGAEINPDRQLELTKADRAEAMRVLRESMIDNRPQLPPDLQAAADASRKAERQSRGNYGPNRFREELEFRLSNNLLENHMEALAELAGGSTDTQLPPRSFLALTTTAVDTPLGYENVEQVDSYHLILGRW